MHAQHLIQIPLQEKSSLSIEPIGQTAAQIPQPQQVSLVLGYTLRMSMAFP